jgi:hypothetical protein
MEDIDTIRAVTTRLVGLPPDPDHLNDNRASRAQSAMTTYMKSKSTDSESCLFDLFVDLRHWADRNGKDFDDTVRRSQDCYIEETLG